MLIPYGTDAPIYYFPRMTIVLIVVNVVTFVITGMGTESDGWLLTYGNGLHPVEWLAYNFLHFGFLHLIGNMFFLWAFGIVVEGKLGWWKFLLLYLGIGVVGGIVIQSAMLGYVPKDLFASQEIAPRQGWFWDDNAVYAQEKDPDVERLNDILKGMNDANEQKPNVELEKALKKALLSQSGAGGASLIIYGLMAIVLIWAPRNEIYCAWIFLRAGLVEVEYLYFCGFYIVTEVLSAIWSVRGFEVTSEIGHATGALIGFGFGILMVKQNWVDCENWDLFSIMSGKHSAAAEVGDWQSRFAIPHVRTREYQSTLIERSGDDSGPVIPVKKKKKSKPKPKLVELESFDEDLDELFDEPAAAPLTKSPKGPTAAGSTTSKGTKSIPNSPKASAGAPTDELGRLIAAGDFKAAMTNYQEQQAIDGNFELPQDELRQLAEGLFKTKAVSDAATLFEEYIRRFPKNADWQRIKLAVLYIQFLKRPAVALKVLAKIDAQRLSDDHRPTYEKAIREAERMIEDAGA